MSIWPRSSSDSLVRQALREGDVDVSPAPASTRLAVHDRRGEEALARFDQAEEFRRTTREERLDDLTHRDESMEEKYRARTQHRRERQALMDRWRDVGAAARFVSSPVPRWAHVPTLAFLAILDAFVFSTAAAVALDVEPSWSEPGYWLGGSFGLVAFASGVLYARSLKSAQFAKVQVGIIRHSPHVPSDLPALLPQVNEVRATGGLFALFTAAGAFVRFEANTNESIGILLLQVLVPVVVVGVEYFVHDPSEVRFPRRTIRHRLVRRQLAAATAAADPEAERAVAAREALEARYKTAKAGYELELMERGFS